MTKKWYRLDTAGLIFPVTRNKKWCNVYRVSANLTEEVDPEILAQAVADLKKRFHSFYVKLRAGIFWYRLEESETLPNVTEDYAYPLTHMGWKDTRKTCIRILYYKNRIAAEVFHCVSDGTGGRIYLINLIHRYLELKEGIPAKPGGIIKDLSKSPRAEELEDSFFKNASPVVASRAESNAYRLKGTWEKDKFRHLTTGTVPTEKLVDAAHSYGCTVNSFLSAVMLQSIMTIQDSEVPLRKQKPVKISIPINLRKHYASNTLRNFTLALNIGVDPRNGKYTLKELCDSINHQLKAEDTPQCMAARIAANTVPQKNIIIRLAPLPLKNLIMNLVYNQVGEKKASINISNMGNVAIPEDMQPYITRFDFIIGPQKSYPNNCSVASYGGNTRINMIRECRESELERIFFSSLVELGIPVEIESN